jgi:hypothetical protein
MIKNRECNNNTVIKQMIKRIPFTAAINVSLVLLGLIMAFHFLVVLQFIPYVIVWGGRLANETEMLRFETASILLNALLAIVIAVKGAYVQLNIPPKTGTAALWFFAGLFSLNTIGNLFAKMTIETVVFTPVTFILAIVCFRIAMEPANLKA